MADAWTDVFERGCELGSMGLKVVLVGREHEKQMTLNDEPEVI